MVTKMAPLTAILTFLKMEVVSQLVPGWVYCLLPVSRFFRLKACSLKGWGPRVGEVTCLGGVKKITLLYMQSYNPAIQGCTFSRLMNGR